MRYFEKFIPKIKSNIKIVYKKIAFDAYLLKL